MTSTTLNINQTLSEWTTNIYNNGTLSTPLSTTTPSPYGKYGPVEQFKIFWAAYYINLYYLWVIFAIGFPGNLASFITILRMPPLTSSTAYVAVLAAVDTLAIIDKLLFHQLTLYDIQMGDTGCRILYYFGSFFAMYANWILVAMTIERFMAIWLPLKVGNYCDGKKAAMIMAIMALVLLIADLQFFWSATQNVGKDGSVDCSFKQEYLQFINLYWYWIDGALYAILPCILLFVFNLLIIFGIRRSGKIQKELTNSKSDQMAEKFRQLRQITIMLVVVSIVFVLLTIPNCLFFIVKPYWTYQENSYEHAQYLLTNQLIFVLSDSNHAVNFYLYFLSGKRFRRRFFDTVLCRRTVRRPFTSVMRTINSNISNTSIYTTPSSKQNGETKFT
ncbi:FMRFamide receptor-like [Patella vulgata]|uniref:FMRFamide receptor-like n=1 Tax=Patella vulgata TaxID=6465 RepID=UPI00217F695D|nr:FMRFamide receptor-like [Patella vulgata]